jgi:hypothetical protein
LPLRAKHRPQVVKRVLLNKVLANKYVASENKLS